MTFAITVAVYKMAFSDIQFSNLCISCSETDDDDDDPSFGFMMVIPQLQTALCVDPSQLDGLKEKV